MQLIHRNPEENHLSLSDDQIRVFQAALREVGEAIADFEFFARVGTTKETVHELCAQLKTLMEEAGINL